MLRIEHVVAHPVEHKTYEYDVGTEDPDRKLVLRVSTKKARRKWYERDKHEEQGVNIGERMIHILGIDRDEEVVGTPVGKEKRERKDV